VHPLVVFWNWICIVVLSYFGLIWFAGSYYYRIIIALQLKILVNEQYLCRRLSFSAESCCVIYEPFCGYFV
jgi:hypothetical protein